MYRKTISAAFAAVILLSLPAWNASADRDPGKKAKILYDKGMYSRAKVLFDASDDPEAGGWAALCALNMRTEGCDILADDYLFSHPESRLAPQIRYRQALNSFDDGDYARAALIMDQIPYGSLYAAQQAGYTYRKAYCEQSLGHNDVAERLFRQVEAMPMSDYTAPSRYAIGYLRYSDNDFEDAVKWFTEAAKDPRFAQTSNYYILECKFMQKDYRYVIRNGAAIYDSVPEDRKPHLARIISESYLVLGDTAGAKEYYDRTVASESIRTRSDYFYAGTLLYSLQDWQGAVDNYSRMNSRTDSLGQVANYQMGYSYIRLKNKVSAMGAFQDASEVGFNPEITEDAYYNYAKLAFDLNHDTSAFNDYLSKYGTKAKGDQIWTYVAMASLYNHDYAGAVAAYDNIDELDEGMRGNYMKAYFMRASQLISNGSYRDAVPCLRAAAYYVPRQDPFNQLSRYWMAESMFRDGRYEEARGVFTDLYNLSALDSSPEGDLIPYDLAYCYFKEGDYASAAKWFGTYLLQDEPVNGGDALTRTGDCHFFRKDYSKAVAAYDMKLQEYPDADDIYPYYMAGLSSGLLGDKAGKVRYLENVKMASPTSQYYPEAMYELGRAYVAVDNPEDATRTFKDLKAVTTDNTFAARSLIELAMISRNARNYDQALSYYKQVVEGMAGTEYADDALLAIETIYQAKQDPDGYISYVKSLGDDSARSEARQENMYFNTAEQIFASGNYEKALATFNSYQSRYPNGVHFSQADYYIAECYRLTGRKELACDYYRKVTGSSGAGSFAEVSARSLADLSYSLDKYSDAFDAYETLSGIARLDANKAAAQVGMMRSGYRARKYAQAIEAARKVKEAKDSGEDIVREADWVMAKSYLETSRRDKSFPILEHLAAYPSTKEGAEAEYILIQDLYDQGAFDKVENRVYAFSSKCGDQSYWLAKAFITLGDTFVEQERYAQAKATFESILSGYKGTGDSGDDVLDQVKMRLDRLAAYTR